MYEAIQYKSQTLYKPGFHSFLCKSQNANCEIIFCCLIYLIYLSITLQTWLHNLRFKTQQPIKIIILASLNFSYFKKQNWLNVPPPPVPSGPAKRFPPAASPHLWPEPTHLSLSACSAQALPNEHPQDRQQPERSLRSREEEGESILVWENLFQTSDRASLKTLFILQSIFIKLKWAIFSKMSLCSRQRS